MNLSTRAVWPQILRTVKANQIEKKNMPIDIKKKMIFLHLVIRFMITYMLILPDEWFYFGRVKQTQEISEKNHIPW